MHEANCDQSDVQKQPTRSESQHEPRCGPAAEVSSQR